MMMKVATTTCRIGGCQTSANKGPARNALALFYETLEARFDLLGSMLRDNQLVKRWFLLHK